MAHPLQANKKALEKSPARVENNVYVTPPELADFLVNWTLENLPTTPHRWKEAGARNNYWQKPLTISGKKVLGIENSIAVDRPDGYEQWVYGDIFSDSEWSTWFTDCTGAGAIGNPPYHNDWRIMVKWLASTIKSYHLVAFLLPHEWLCGTNRIEQLYSVQMPEYVLNLSPRIPFTGGGNTRLNSFYIWNKRWTEGYYKGIPINWKES